MAWELHNLLQDQLCKNSMRHSGLPGRYAYNGIPVPSGHLSLLRTSNLLHMKDQRVATYTAPNSFSEDKAWAQFWEHCTPGTVPSASTGKTAPSTTPSALPSLLTTSQQASHSHWIYPHAIQHTILDFMLDFITHVGRLKHSKLKRNREKLIPWGHRSSTQDLDDARSQVRYRIDEYSLSTSEKTGSKQPVPPGWPATNITPTVLTEQGAHSHSQFSADRRRAIRADPASKGISCLVLKHVRINNCMIARKTASHHKNAKQKKSCTQHHGVLGHADINVSSYFTYFCQILFLTWKTVHHFCFETAYIKLVQKVHVYSSEKFSCKCIFGGFKQDQINFGNKGKRWAKPTFLFSQSFLPKLSIWFFSFSAMSLWYSKF